MSSLTTNRVIPADELAMITERLTGESPPPIIGVSLKMYFDHRQTLDWCKNVRSRVRARPVPTTTVELVILPSFESLTGVAEILAGTDIRLGAQDLFWEDRGPFTGEVSGASLRQVGCTYAEVGHAERRRLFHEDREAVGAKTVSALRHGLTPIICVGDATPTDGASAAKECVSDLECICESVLHLSARSRLIIAYEPEWAIGADAHAPIDYIGEVCDGISKWVSSHEQLIGSQVIYGGSAGPGLLTALHDHLDGLFLGRAAHDVAVLDGIIDEAISVAA